MRFLASHRNDKYLDTLAFGRGSFAASPQNYPSQMHSVIKLAVILSVMKCSEESQH